MTGAKVCARLARITLSAALSLAGAAGLEGQSPEPAEVVIRWGSTPAVDGRLAPGEWEDADSVHIPVEAGWTVTARYKHDEDNLFFAFSGLRRGDREMYPEVLLDTDGDRTPEWEAGDWWLHASYRDCEGDGRPNDYASCRPDLPGWAASNFPLDGRDAVEIRVSYAKLRLVPGRDRKVGIALGVTDTREKWIFRPAGATLERPSTWAVVSSPDRWLRPAAGAALRGRVETFRMTSRLLPDSFEVPVYLPPGYDPSRRYPTVYAFHGPVYFTFPAARGLPAVDSAMAAGSAPVLLVGVPFTRAERAHHPDTPAGEAFRRFVATELVPEVERRYPTGGGRGRRLLLGFSSGANTALHVGVRHAEVFGRVAAQSPGWMDWDGARSTLGRKFLAETLQEVRESRGALPAVWLAWGDGDLEWESLSRVHGEEMIRALRARGASVERAPDVAGEHGLHLIHSTLPGALSFLLSSP